MTSVDSSAVALNRLEEDPPDCIVSDYDMPGQSGLALLRGVRETYPELPFVLFTGKGTEEVAAEAIQHGVSGYVQKGGTEKFGLLATQIHNTVTAARAEHERRKRASASPSLGRSSMLTVGASASPRARREALASSSSRTERIRIPALLLGSRGTHRKGRTGDGCRGNAGLHGERDSAPLVSPRQRLSTVVERNGDHDRRVPGVRRTGAERRSKRLTKTW